MAAPKNIFEAGLAKLHESEEFSDCKIICGPYHFNVHKVVLASQSDYFKTAFKKGTFKEGKSGTIRLKSIEKDATDADELDDACDDPEIVKLMVEYFYHFDYLRDAAQVQSNDTEEATPSKKPKLATKTRAQAASLATVDVGHSASQPLTERVFMVEHAKVFAMAVKYQVDGLQSLALAKFISSVTTHWNHEDFAHTIFVAFNSTPEDVTQVRDVVTNALHEHFEELQNKAEIETVVCGLPRLTYGLLKRSREPKASRSCEQKSHPSPSLYNLNCVFCNITTKACQSCCNGYRSCTCPKCGRIA